MFNLYNTRAEKEGEELRVELTWTWLVLQNTWNTTDGMCNFLLPDRQI